MAARRPERMEHGGDATEVRLPTDYRPAQNRTERRAQERDARGEGRHR
jgi:hypothetical protein